MDHRADAIAAGIQSRLAEVGDQLSRWVSSDRFQPPAVDGAVIFAVRDGSIEVAPKGALPFVPVAVPVSPLGNLFAAAEALEFRGREISRAAQAYRMLSRHSDARLQAEAQMRLGRVLRKTREFARTIDAYRSLASAGDIQVGGLPAGLVGLEGQSTTPHNRTPWWMFMNPGSPRGRQA